MNPSPGLYEQLITAAVKEWLDGLGDDLHAKTSELRREEAADRIAFFLNRVVYRAIAQIPEKNRTDQALVLTREVLLAIGRSVEQDLSHDHPIAPCTILESITGIRPDGTPAEIEKPRIPLLDTTLLTNSPGEPNVGKQIATEIDSADRIDVVMAFIRFSGIRRLKDALQAYVQSGRPLRFLTTVYTGSTEARALDLLKDMGADVRVSYDTNTTRLHAKAWLFHRDSGFSTAYIGSSNLTYSAQCDGLEWNVRVSGARNPDVIDKVTAVFDSYWSGCEFVAYEREEFERRRSETSPVGPQVLLPQTHVRLYPYQDRLLEQIALARKRGHQRNLLVAATGTGKTVMAGMDYARLRKELPRARLLFVAHRKEILQQSRATFCHCLTDATFGEMWVAGKRPSDFEHVFASIQSLDRNGYDRLTPDHFDVVIIDEFHHAAAKSYQRLLRHVQPQQLLGLTATPERSDGLPIVELFGGRIAAELRLWDAIDQQRLTPFDYYGIHDGLDLREVPWKKGRGYDVSALSQVVTGNEIWARQVVREVADRVDSVSSMRALGYCVSVEHARFMERIFNESNIPSRAIWAQTSAEDRQSALDALSRGDLSVIFSVDLFNEGVDLPLVDTLLLLRPTDSPTLFLQQLGRGLRLAEGKVVCTVLDFVGHHRKEFRFDRRFRALFPGSRKELIDQIKSGFPVLPAGCHMSLDRVATESVIRNIKESLPSTWPARAEELRQFASARTNVTLAEFLRESDIELEDVYSGSHSWSDLRQKAALPVATQGQHEKELRRACGRLLHIDDELRIERYRQFLSQDKAPDVARLSEHDHRLLRMLVASVGRSALEKTMNLAEASTLIWEHSQVRVELLELLEVLESRITHLQCALLDERDVPLRIHARYTRDEILAAFGVGSAARVAPWQTGTYFVKDKSADLHAFTLDKTSGQFSPTTRYRDYAINRELIHWESQSGVRADSATGRRYQEHQARGVAQMFFARLRQNDRAFWFLGPGAYVGHRSERPMAITWRLQVPLPGDLYHEFAAVASG